MKKIASVFLVVFLAIGCSRNNWMKGYEHMGAGFYYKLLGIGDGNNCPKADEVIITEAVMKAQNDSVFWDTYHDSNNGLYIDLGSSNMPTALKTQLLKLVEGDSASFLVNSHTFFKLFFDTIVPPFCVKDSLVKIDVKIHQIISKYEYAAIKANADLVETEDVELEELQDIDCYILNDYPKAKVDEQGLYWLEKNAGSREQVTSGKKVKVEYQGFFMDGKPVDAAKQQIEFIYGTPDQLIKGLNIVIGSLKKGESAKIIVPSRLAFGEKGSSNGSVPPYTPLVYKLKIIDIK